MWLDHERRRDLGLLFIRAIVGTVFLFHGLQKLFGAFEGPGLIGFAGYLAQQGVPLPQVSAVLAASAEFLGGLALLTGVGTAVAAVPLVATMLVASFAMHGGAFDSLKGGMEYPLTLALTVAGIGLTGPGRWTLAALIQHSAHTPAPRREAAATQ